MRACCVYVLLITALATMCSTGGAAAGQSSVQLERIAINAAHPNDITVFFDGAKSHSLLISIGGPVVKPEKMSPSLNGSFFTTKARDGIPEQGWTNARFRPNSNRFAVHVTYPTGTGSVGHGACYVATILMDNKSIVDTQTRIHCINSPNNDTNT